MLLGHALVTLLSDGKTNSVSRWEGDESLVSLSDDEDVGDASGEGVSSCILDVDDVRCSWETLTMSDDSNTTNVTTSGDVGQVSWLELDEVRNLLCVNVEDDGIVDLDVWVWVTDGASVCGGEHWNSLVEGADRADLAELEVSLSSLDSVDNITSLGIVEHAEILVSAVDGDNIHESSWELVAGSDLSVDADYSLGEDLLGFGVVESVLQTVTKEQAEWERLAELVWSWVWTDGEDSSEFVKHPVLWGSKALKMLLWSSHFQVCNNF